MTENSRKKHCKMGHQTFMSESVFFRTIRAKEKKIKRHFLPDYILKRSDSVLQQSYQSTNVALRRRIECGFVFVSVFGLVLPARITVLRLCRSLEGEMILSHCVRVNHELFTEWIISQLHTEWCGAWRDENSAPRWLRCSVITHWESCYLRTRLKVANSRCLCCALSLSDSPAGFLHAPQGVCLFSWLQNILIYCADKEVSLPWKVRPGTLAFDCSGTSGAGDAEAGYWQAKWCIFPFWRTWGCLW